MATFTVPPSSSSSTSSFSSYHTCFSERQPSIHSAESNLHDDPDTDQNTGKDTSRPRRPRIPFGFRESWPSSSSSSPNVDSNNATSSDFSASMRALLSSDEARESINVGEQLAKLDQKIEENRNDREVLREAADVARKYGQWQLAEKLVRMWGKVVVTGVPLRAMRRKLRKKTDEDIRRREEQPGSHQLPKNR